MLYLKYSLALVAFMGAAVVAFAELQSLNPAASVSADVQSEVQNSAFVVNAIQACSAKGKIYAPGAATVDADGCTANMEVVEGNCGKNLEGKPLRSGEIFIGRPQMVNGTRVNSLPNMPKSKDAAGAQACEYVNGGSGVVLFQCLEGKLVKIGCTTIMAEGGR